MPERDIIFERLESRLLMSIGTTGALIIDSGVVPYVPWPSVTRRGTLGVTFRDGDHSVTIKPADGNNIQISWTGTSGSVSRFLAPDYIKRIGVTGTDGSDNIFIDDRMKWPARISGGAGADVIVGGSRADVIDGGDGNDRINGGDGNDSITGGAGNDRINGEDGYDFIDGGSSRDIITGGAGEDTLFGGGGNDHLDGGRATDVMHGGAGNDTFAAIDTFGNHDSIFGERGIDQLVNANEDDLFDPGSQTNR